MVVDAQGEPIVGAIVNITRMGGGRSAVDLETDQKGVYQFSQLLERDETYFVELVSSYRSSPVTVNWNPADCTRNLITVDFAPIKLEQ